MHLQNELQITIIQFNSRVLQSPFAELDYMLETNILMHLTVK